MTGISTRHRHEKSIPAQFLREMFAYREDGFLIRRIKCGNRVAGSIAGRVQSGGYWRVAVKGRSIGVHRIIWCLIHGHWPSAEIDHINCNPADNRIENLREADSSANSANRRPRGTKIGHLKGTTQIPSGRWQAQIGHRGSARYLGTFDSADLAHEAYLSAAVALHGEFARAA